VGEERYEGRMKRDVEDGFLRSWFLNQIIEICEGAKELCNMMNLLRRMMNLALGGYC